MRLKQLRINGFKSFADTTVIEFPGAVSGIVGPNGCGKSNVIDAIRWVLGEARVSELRGSNSMSELIFAGSSQRPASSRASVEMVLDNSDGSIAGAWGRYTELSVKRIVTRDGSNAYLINNQQVRRRDVQDIFLGTGLGPRSYAIISQGMISNFIKAKPEELRVYLEEAAGVSKYKERRKETETALNSTRNNLEKVHYLQETKRQEIERLTAEAEVAKKWRVLEDERMTNELLWYFVQETDAKNSIDKINAQIAQKEAAILECRGESQRLVVEIENLRQKAREMREAADSAREAAWKANAKVAEIEGNIRHIVEQKDSLTRQIASQKDTMARRANEKTEALSRIEEFKRLSAENLEKAESLEEEAAALEEESFEKNDEYEDLRQKYDEARKAENAAQQKIGILQVKLEALSREYDTILERIEALRAETRPGAAPDEERFEELKAELEDKTAELEEASAQAEELGQSLLDAQTKFDEVRNTKERLSESVGRTAARLQTLEAVQAKAEGEGRLPEWLERMGLNTLPKLFESLTVDSGWAVALEAVLSVMASALAMTELNRAAGFSYDPPPARLVFYGKSVKESEAVSMDGFKPLTDYVHSDNPLIDATVKSWLTGVFTAETVDAAVNARAQMPAGARIVVKEGHIIDAVSISYWAEESTGAGLVSRAAEIRDLKAREESERRELEKAGEELISAKARVADAEVHHKAKLAFVDAVKNQRHTLEVEYSALKAAIDAYRARSLKVAQELEELTARRDEVDEERGTCEEEFETSDAKLSVLQQASADAQTQLEYAEQAVADIEERTRQAQNSARMARMEAKNAADRIADAERQSKTADEELSLMQETIEELTAQLEELDETAEREGLGEVLADRDAKNQAHIEAEAASNAAENEVEAARERQQKLNDDQTPMLQEISDMKVRRENWATQTTAFTQRLDECGADRDALREVVVRESLKASGLKAKVTRLSQEIADLGAVNHAALENLEASQKAMEETERQVADLDEAIANLEATIRKIDAETRELLRNTFDEVNRNFSEMFTSLFGGGNAQLKMSGDEILESGVEVIAQPPGKKNANVKLLSGGEQAMTATALVFAIFRLNPAPFCLLDEVDAPLDEANQDRLARRIVEMSKATQFMMITHHRVTMEHIGQLVGVTMKEPGVSRVVAVDVAAAVDMAQSG